MWETKEITNPKDLIGKKVYKRSYWEKEEIKILIQMWDTSTIAEICAKLGRSPTGIANIVTILRKKYNIPLAKKNIFGGPKLIDIIRGVLKEMGLPYNK